MTTKIELEADKCGIRIDSYISENCEDITRSAASKLIENSNVFVNEKIVSKSYKVALGDRIEINLPEPIPAQAAAENIPLDIVYEDEYLLVVNKPQGMVVHPAAGNYDGTLVNALLYHCQDGLSGINGVIRPGIVHRIDKNTSGLLIVAKTDKAHLGLAEQIKVHSFKRQYSAILCGNVKEDSFTVDKPIARSKKDRKKMAVDVTGRNAVTEFEVNKRFGKYTLVTCTLQTGRTHQIRVHSAYMHHPVAGDDVYGKAEKGLVGQCLHARTIGFVHPISGEYMEFTSKLPKYFLDFINKIEK